jgi:hypothetical protein
MKNSIKLTALFLLASTGLFAAVPSKTIGVVPPSKDVITFSSLPSHKGVEIKVDRAEPGKAIVTIYDKDENVIYKDALPGSFKAMEKGYILNQLDNGDYKIEVTSNKQTVTKEIHVYDEDHSRVFIVKQS